MNIIERTKRGPVYLAYGMLSDINFSVTKFHKGNIYLEDLWKYQKRLNL